MNRLTQWVELAGDTVLMTLRLSSATRSTLDRVAESDGLVTVRSATQRLQRVDVHLEAPSSKSKKITWDQWQKLDKKRERCTHYDEDDNKKTSKYGAGAAGLFLKCNLCGRRWEWINERWQTYDVEAVRQALSP